MARMAKADSPVSARPALPRGRRAAAIVPIAPLSPAGPLSLFDASPVSPVPAALEVAPALPARPVAAIVPPARAAAAKPRLKSGYGLWTRSAEGEDSMMPFRSLDDLLSAVKPILRASAGSPEPVWFSIQPVDLAEMDTETL